MQAASILSSTDILPSVPKRKVWAIDQLKHTARLEDLHTIGIDPGKREIVVGVDMDHPKSGPTVRYGMPATRPAEVTAHMNNRTEQGQSCTLLLTHRAPAVA
jgi:hypothetical protein